MHFHSRHQFNYPRSSQSFEINPASMAGCLPRGLPGPPQVHVSAAAAGVHEGEPPGLRPQHQGRIQAREDEKRRRD